MERKREHLAKLIATSPNARPHIARQREIIQHAVEQGQPADLAEGCCAPWRKAFVAFERHRQVILERMKTASR